MAILTQLPGEPTFYLGWYGMCPELGSSQAKELSLRTSEYASSGSFARWNDGQNFHNRLTRVTQIEATGKGFAYFDQLLRESLESTGLGNFFTPAFDKLIPGKAYMITIRNAPGAVGSGTAATISIPEFYWTRTLEPDSTYRLTDNCYTGSF